MCSHADVALSFSPDSDLLPAGRHRATIAEIERLLVTDFPTSLSRRPIFDSWRNVVAAIQRVVPVAGHWIDGSFVTTKENPQDIDIVTIFDAPEVEKLDQPSQVLLKGLVYSKVSQALHRCDSYAIVRYPPGHSAQPQYEAAVAYWDDWFGKTRDGRPKGYIEVVLP